MIVTAGCRQELAESDPIAGERAPTVLSALLRHRRRRRRCGLN